MNQVSYTLRYFNTFYEYQALSIPHCNFLAYQHLSKMIEVSRVYLFDIMTQYRAIFPDDDPFFIGQNSDPLLGGLFYKWVNEKVRIQCTVYAVILGSYILWNTSL